MRAEEEPEGIIAHVVRYELIIVLAVAPLMLFPNRASIAGLVVVALVWLARWVAYKRLTRPSAMNAPESGATPPANASWYLACSSGAIVWADSAAAMSAASCSDAPPLPIDESQASSIGMKVSS